VRTCPTLLLALGSLALGACASSPLPADDARIRSQADLQAYLDAFNEKRYADQIRYYAPDVSYNVGTLAITSPQQIADFYDDFHDYVNEHVEVGAFAMTGDTVAVAMPSRFEAFRTYDKNGLLFEEGSVRESVSFIFYELEDGKIRRIRMARYGGAYEDFAE
jgi:limonene-1,2-epoxide hydrolase